MTQGNIESKIGQQVRLEGVARDAKGGAVLILDDGTPVYMENLDYWDENTQGQIVIASGTLVRVKYIPDPVVDENGAISQGAEGLQLVLRQPEIEINRNERNE
ncbi:hypothetical protein GF325_14030 [Candidatus Bathyarchaeota archaeon]|nr:hypothetical protein [Candidatus Bathyarchaeota archaeon]